ncbi:uncharacterized protein LOC121870466 isoform X3 [Homarus americanus]|uniref:Longitudinals lacking protein-like 14 n=1 Tax=Homarus americanus TaxID=6706 RepID=A0A8J5JXS0_HOMAM|nr:uncharacterized protein LOC121870466 isoform X3 [Homarus americanus]XP_042228229.1 uncharacterized protein LOC121870466 isoform X3 [Homarus americanus]KAG7165556.1 Longitudinals lacking protein-like 14 [Homarus americanus]
MGKRRSGVWRHFEEEGERKVACRVCRTQLTTQGNTSIMLRHLRRKHPKMMDGLFVAKGSMTSRESCHAEELPLGAETHSCRKSGIIGKKRSGVWRHYEEEGERKVSCRLCHTQLTKQGNTSALLRHLRRKHPEKMDGIFETEEPLATREEGSWQVEEREMEQGTPTFFVSGKGEQTAGWKHFQDEGQNKATCKVSHKDQTAKHRKPTSVQQQIHRKHPAELKVDELQEEDRQRKLNYVLQSNNAETHFLPVCERLFQNNQLTDCTLMAEGQFIHAHRLVLAMCSESFEEVFKTMTHTNPAVVLHDITIHELRELMNFMYRGKIDVRSEDLPGLLKAASKLKIKGLSDVGFVKSLLDDLQTSTSCPGKAYCHEDEDMEDLDEDYSGHHSKLSTQGHTTCETSIASSVEVEPQNINLSGQEDAPDGSTTINRVHIKLERGTEHHESEVQASFEIPSPVNPLLHHQSEHMPEPEIISTQEEAIHLEPLVTHEINSCDGTTQVTTSITHAEPGEQSSLTTTTTVLEDSGGLGLTGGESHIHISTAGTSTETTATSHPLQPSLLAQSRKYSKGDLLAAVNLVRDGHLGVKAASRAFNIPPTTLSRASKRPDNPIIIKQEVDKPEGGLDEKFTE